METSIAQPQLTDSSQREFSIKRLSLIGRYYFHTFRQQMWIYPAVSLVASGIAYLCLYSPLSIISSMIISMISFMFYFAPIVLGRHDDRMAMTMLPATPLEKWTFLSAYFFILIPVLTNGPELAVAISSHYLTPEHDLLKQLRPENILNYSPSPIYFATALVPTVLCFWGMLHFRENRIIKAILLMFGGLFAIGIITGSYAFIAGFRAALNRQPYDPNAGEHITNQVLSQLDPLFTTLGILSVITFAIMLWRSYAAIKKYQA